MNEKALSTVDRIRDEVSKHQDKIPVIAGVGLITIIILWLLSRKKEGVQNEGTT